MIAKKIPLYFYEENTSNQVGTGNVILLQDNTLVEQYKNSPYSTLLYRWQDVNLTSLGKEVNKFLNAPLLSDSLTFYSKIVDGDAYPSIATSACDTANIYGSPVSIPVADFNKNYIYKTLDNYVLSETIASVSYNTNPPPAVNAVYGNSPYYNWYFNNYGTRNFNILIRVFSEDLFDADGNVKEDKRNDAISFEISGAFAADFKSITSASLYVSPDRFGSAFNLNTSQAKDTDLNNPYDDDGDNGGDGDNTDPTITEGTEVPSLPTIGASDFVTIYNPTGAKLNSLADFLWSTNMFDLNDYKRLYEDPMECLIGLAVLPCIPNAAGTKNIRFGNVDTGINCSYLTSQWAQVDCGSVNIKTTANSFMDYSPFVKLQIFLPFIGFQSLDADDVMGASLKVVYNVDILSGDCVAFIRHSKRGVIYSYNGNCLCNIPMTAQSYAGAMRGYYQTLANTIPSMISGGATGGAAGAAVEGVKGLGEAGLQVMTSKPTHQRSGTMSGAASIMGVKKPFIVIERPNVSVPDYVQNYAGLSANVTSNLGSLRGFTTCDYVHIEGLKATDAELQEIENLLHSGVIL